MIALQHSDSGFDTDPAEQQRPAPVGMQRVECASLAGVFKGSHTQGSVRDIVFLSSTSAVLDVDNELTGYSALPPGTVETAPGVQRGHHKRIVVNRNGVWRILQMQSRILRRRGNAVLGLRRRSGVGV